MKTIAQQFAEAITEAVESLPPLQQKHFELLLHGDSIGQDNTKALRNAINDHNRRMPGAAKPIGFTASNLSLLLYRAIR